MQGADVDCRDHKQASGVLMHRKVAKTRSGDDDESLYTMPRLPRSINNSIILASPRLFSLSIPVQRIALTWSKKTMKVKSNHYIRSFLLAMIQIQLTGSIGNKMREKMMENMIQTNKACAPARG